MSLTREQLIEATTKTLIEQGAGADNSIHSWRCDYPDRYGACSCVQDTGLAVLDTVLEAVAGHYEQMERSHPASDGPTVIYAYEVVQHLRSLLTTGQTSE